MNSQLKILLAIVVLGVAVAGYEFHDFYNTEVPAMATQRHNVERELASRQDELRRLQDFVQNIEVIKQELRELNLQLESALEHMPRSFNLSGLLRNLAMLAQNSGLELSAFKPAEKEEKVQGAFYNFINIDFELHGSFTQTLVFFDQVSRLKRIINIDNIDIEPSSQTQTGPRAGATSLLTRVTVRTYRFSE